MNNQKIKDLIKHYNNIVNNINNSIEKAYCITFIRELEALLEPECKHDTGGNLTVDELIEVHNK